MYGYDILDAGFVFASSPLYLLLFLLQFFSHTRSKFTSLRVNTLSSASGAIFFILYHRARFFPARFALLCFALNVKIEIELVS